MERSTSVIAASMLRVAAHHAAWRALVACLIIVGSVGCDRLPQPSMTPARELAAARARWAAIGVQSYRFTLDVQCFCGFGDPLQVIVEDGLVVTLRRASGDVPVDVASAWPTTIEAAFAMVEKSLGADELRVQYDQLTGIPTRVTVDHDLNMADDRFSWQITGWAPSG